MTMMNKYVIDVEFESEEIPDEFSDVLAARKRVLINDAEIAEKPGELVVSDFLEEKYGHKIKSWQLVRIIGDGPDKLAGEMPDISVVQDSVNVTTFLEVDMDFVQALITAVNESKLPLGTKTITRNKLDKLQEALMSRNTLWVI